MISVAEALERLFALVAPLPSETVALRHGAGRVLAQDAIATRTQPPFAASAMDGYAVRAEDAYPGATLHVIGEAAAGGHFDGPLLPAQAIRIFTGAPVPAGADRVVIQEDVQRDGDRITLAANLDAGHHIRPAGGDFVAGSVVGRGKRLRPADLALLAAMNLPELHVARRPEVALICTGDELVMPGETPGPDQIIVSNNFGLSAMFEAEGARVRLLPIAHDNEPSLAQAFALAANADLIVTSGGASVGDHDLVASVASRHGLAMEFHKVAMRPGKPLMAGRMTGIPMIGLPGNPVSSMVCGAIFIVPVLRAMQGLPAASIARHQAPLRAPLAANGNREHYMRALVTPDGIAALPRQDSSLLSVLAEANALLVRPVGDPARELGEVMNYIPL